MFVEYESTCIFCDTVPCKGLCKSFKKWLLIPRGDEGLYAVLYPRESDSAQYDTPGRLTLRSMIPRGDFYEKF